MKKKIFLSHILIHILLIIGAVIMIFPFVWMVLTSLKTVTESTSMNPYVYIPKVLMDKLCNCMAE
jgi:multiple sugar transport system permease protein